MHAEDLFYFIGSDKGSGLTYLVVYLLMNFAHVFDCAEGMLARLSNQITESGGFLDNVIDLV